MRKTSEALLELRLSAEKLFFHLPHSVIERDEGMIAVPHIQDGRRNAAPLPVHYKAALNVLRCVVLNQMPPESDTKLLSEVLNLPIEVNAIMQGGGIVVNRSGHALRFIAEALLDYLLCLTQNPQLRKQAPVTVCAHCAGLFLRARTDKRFCSDTCRMKGKGSVYFAAKARSSRAVKKALNRNKRESGSIKKRKK
jgi:hypothetical protein